MSTWLPRSYVTTHLLAALDANFTFPIGDNATPTEPYGWQGEPNAEGTNFIPWVTLSSGNASVSSGSLAASQSEWRATYFLSVAGVTRKQTEGVADIARSVLVNTERTAVVAPNASWKILQVRVTSIGGVSRLHQVTPSYFVQTDTFEIWLSKENS